MNFKQYQWNVLHDQIASSTEEVVDILLENRGLKTNEEKELFFDPAHPSNITLRELDIDEREVEKAIKRIKKGIKDEENIILYGDYDADGVCSTAILWQTLYSFTKKATPFLPDRFIDGYGLHPEGVKRLKSQNPNIKLIITVDNGIVANDAVEVANKLGIDVIITDHHQKGKKLPDAYAIVHTDRICGSEVAWILGREICKALTTDYRLLITDLLDLVAIGTIADQMPLIDVNRSFAKHGLEVLNRTKRLGLLALFETAGITPGTFGTYEVNYHIAPRINAMGRLENAMDSLRLLCTTNIQKAKELANVLGKVNEERQKMVVDMVAHAKSEAAKREWLGAIVIAHETYHEGVIGLIASKLVDEFYRPVIVLSKGETMSKASARSISGFNVIENIRKLDRLLSGGGGHPMAAGFSIESSKIDEFVNEMEKVSKEVLTKELLQRKINVDMALPFEIINNDLLDKLDRFTPYGINNPAPLFVSEEVLVENAVLVGTEKKHIKMKVSDGSISFDSIAFNFGELYPSLSPETLVDVVYSIEMNYWNGRSTIQLKIRDIKIKS